jgi:DNA-binding NarL/FixJ family response regulator
MKILLVDDHVLFREGMKLLLAKLHPSATFVEAGDLPQALRAAAAHDDIDLALFDLGLPGVHGLDALSEFRLAHDGIPTVVLSAMEDRQTVLDALSRGAMGFIPKANSVDSLHEAFKTVLDQGIYIPGAILSGPPPSPGPRRPEPLPSKGLRELGLTERQMQVFRLVMQGKSNKAIARDLSIAESTIKQHVKPILKTLNATSRVGAILEVARLGISLEH